MAFTLTFPTAGPLPGPAEIAGWLTEQGEAFEEEGPGVLLLRAIPLRVVFSESGQIQGQVDLRTATPLSRVVRLVFDLSMRLGADVRLAGVGEVQRTALWLRLADEQDRLRIARALVAADEHSKRDEIHTHLWRMLSTLAAGRNVRWDGDRRALVELKEVGAADGISLEEAAWLTETPSAGDTVAVPVEGDMHILAWRWLSEAYPSLATA